MSNEDAEKARELLEAVERMQTGALGVHDEGVKLVRALGPQLAVQMAAVYAQLGQR